MTALDDAKLDLLNHELEAHYVHHLPPMQRSNKPPEDIRKKNLSRALSAYALAQVCEITPQQAAANVVDDFDDGGVDAIYWHQATDTLYLVQAKLKKGADFKLDEALKFGQGISKLLAQDLASLNQHVQRRRTDIETAIEDAARVSALVVFVGGQISTQAHESLNAALAQEAENDERVDTTLQVLNGALLANFLQQAKAWQTVDVDLYINNSSRIGSGRKAYIGVATLTDLIKFHHEYGDALYDKNIRTFLGRKSAVNKSIVSSLENDPSDFFFLNNGVTVLCKLIDPKGKARNNGQGRKFVLRGLSVINGAQTISSAAEFIRDNPTADLRDARVAITLIQADTQGDFSKSVTRARNHQNPVRNADFVSLDSEQERLRQEISYLGIRYIYKAGAQAEASTSSIHVAEASRALAMFSPDPRVAVWAKQEPAKLLESSSVLYSSLFARTVSAHELVDAVHYLRYVESRMRQEEQQANVDKERKTYRHGVYALGWLLAKQVRDAQRKTGIFAPEKLAAQMSQPFDSLRQRLVTHLNSGSLTCGPLAFFRSGSFVLPALEALAIEEFGLASDVAISSIRTQGDPQADYPKPLFDYLISKAPQIGDLS